MSMRLNGSNSTFYYPDDVLSFSMAKGRSNRKAKKSVSTNDERPRTRARRPVSPGTASPARATRSSNLSRQSATNKRCPASTSRSSSRGSTERETSSTNAVGREPGAPTRGRKVKNPLKLVGRRKENRGGARENSGRHRVNGIGASRSTIGRRADDIEREVENTGNFSALRKAFIHEVKTRFGDDAATIVEKITEREDQDKAAEILRKWDAEEATPLEPEDCLAFLLTMDLTKHKYSNIIKIVNDAAGESIFKCYETTRKYKSLCMPETGTVITELRAKTSLQQLINHTVERTVEAYRTEIDFASLVRTDGIIPATFTFCWGFDGASGQRMYRMAYSNQDNGDRDDSSLFAAVLSPILLQDGNSNILWKNLNSQSSSSVRPILLEFHKETTAYVINVKNEINREIRALEPVTVEVGNGKSLCVHARMLLTLIDGKGFNIITGTHSSRCPICHAGRNEINNFENHGTDIFAPRGHGLLHGIQGMHGWIKFAEHVFQLAYNIPVWEAEQEGLEFDADDLKADTKQQIQDAYRREKGLRIDMPAQFGSGNTMDGNTSRRIFQDCAFLSETTGIPEHLLKRYHVVLCVINSVYYKPVQQFEDYCFETLTLFKERYPRYTVTPSVHKVCMYGQLVLLHY